MNVLDLFSGIGGFSLGLHLAGFNTVAFCETEPYCRAVLNKHWPDIPCHPDILGLDGEQYRGTVDLVCGGFPCQPFSVAGDRRGEADDRALWPEMLRIIGECQPSWVIGENVTGFIGMGLDSCMSDLEGIGYRGRAFVIPACAVGASHQRDRVWVVANSNSAHSKRDKRSQRGEQERTNDSQPFRWEAFNGIHRMDDGLPKRVDRHWAKRVHALGNAVVPQIPEIIGRAIMEAENGG